MKSMAFHKYQLAENVFRAAGRSPRYHIPPPCGVKMRVAHQTESGRYRAHFHKNREHVSRFALIEPPYSGGIRIEAYGLYKTTLNCARRARFRVANSIGSLVPIERVKTSAAVRSARRTGR